MTSGDNNFKDFPSYLIQYLTVLCTNDAVILQPSLSGI